MAEVTDEMLMAYADGALSALARTKVETFLEGTPEARRRVEIFRATGAPLSKLYGKPMTEPVPAHLKDFVLNYRAEAKAAEARPSKAGWLQRIGRKAPFFTKPAGGGGWFDSSVFAAHWQIAAASAVSLAVGMVIGAAFDGGSGSNELAAFSDGRLYASGALRDVLEKELSGRETRIGGVGSEAVTMRASLTFKAKKNCYCREYEIAKPGNEAVVGLGCRDRDGKWTLEAQLPTTNAAAKGSIKAAAANTALDSIVDDMIDGDALGGKQESAVIANGWK